jgi:serine/threonine protein kinase
MKRIRGTNGLRMINKGFPNASEEAVTELKMLLKLNHPNVLKVEKVFRDKEGNLCYTMPYAYAGDLSIEVMFRVEKRKK